MSTNPIKYTSRTFLTALADINADPLLVDKPDWFKRLIAGAVDVASTWENASANNGFLRTAMTRRAVTDLCALIDYSLVPQTTASGIEFFDADPAAVMPFTLSQENAIANGQSGIGSSALRYSSRAPITFTSLTEALLPAAFNIGTGQITVSGASYTTGEKVRITSSGSLPTGLSAATDYFVIADSATLVRLASTRALAFLGTRIAFSTTGSGTITLTRLSRSASVYQQNDVAGFIVGSSDGVTGFQEFDLSQIGVLPDTVAIQVSGQAYMRVDTLALSAPTDKVFRLYYNTDGTVTIRFGDGTYGAIPPSAAVYVSYSYGGGARSNVTYPNQVTAYAGGDSNVKGCFNSTAMTGGADSESLESAKKNAPMLLKARSRFVTIDDGIALAISYGGLSIVAINKNVYGVLSCQVVGIATGGGNPSTGIRTAIASYLMSLSPLEAVYVQFDNATLTPVTVAMNVHMKPGYTWAGVSGYVDIATRIFFSETSQQIYDSYLSGGIEAATTLINTVFSKSFGSADYSVIESILLSIGANGTRYFGDSIQLSDLYAVCSSVAGVDYVVLTSSTPALPYSCAAAEIVTMTGGSVTLTEV